MEERSSASEDQVMVDGDDNSEVEGEEVPTFEVKVTHEAKLRELLHKINSIEIKLCSDGVKEFIKLLKGNTGGELLYLYVRSSSKFSELLDAWKLRRGKPGLSYVLSLVSTILGHPYGMYNPKIVERISISRVLDKFAKLLIEEYMTDVYKELNSKEVKCQKAALLLMASIVRRGSGLASEFAKKFDFKLKVFSKLAEYKKNQNEKRMKRSLRKAFVGLSMSFLEVGRPGLLRWVLQQKEMYSGVLRGLGNDDDETVIYVLSTLRDRILVEESLVPPGLRSVLFGSVTLEQLVNISGRENGGPAAELSYRILVLVCTDPCNGLMPDLKRRPSPLKGNPTRLVGLMKKLKATEIGYHRDLLLAIVSGSPSFGSAYMEDFPYNLEDFASPTWFATVSLAANLVSSVGTGCHFDFLDSQCHPGSFDNEDVQSILKCLFPRPFSRSVINKGLLHSDFLVKHGILRLLLEALKLLDSFIGALNHSSCLSDQMMQGWASLRQEIQNEVRTSLPDPQVLLTLLSSLTRHSTRESCLKRTPDLENFTERSSNNVKKLKINFVNEDTDIVVSGISSAPDFASPADSERPVGSLAADETDDGKDLMGVIAEIWGLELHSVPLITQKDTEMFFQTKLLDALKIYIRTVPNMLEGSFEFFINLLTNPLALPTSTQCCLLSLLIEYVGFSPSSGFPIRTPPLMYRHLQPFINLLIFSPTSDIKDLSYSLAQAAMFSTGAFDRNLDEIGAWFLFLPGYNRVKTPAKVLGVELLHSLSQVVISFLCDAISTIGNNLFKYWDIVKHYTYHLKGVKDVSPSFSPLVVCVLQKCLRLLTSESGSFTLPEKSIISLYVCNTLKYLLQTQVDAGLLSALVELVMSEKLGDRCCVVDDSGDFFCEWRPLKNLLIFSQSISNQQTSCIFSTDKTAMPVDSSFASIIDEVNRFIRSGDDGGNIAGITQSFSSSIICTSSDGILKNFPSVMTISRNLLGVPMPILSSVFFLEQGLLTSVSKLWPDMFFPGLEMALSIIHCEDKEDDASGNSGRSLDSQVMIYNGDFGADECVAAFTFFLKQAPFHVLFPAIMNIDGPYSLEPMKIQDLLLTKLSDSTADDHRISYLRLVLFWIHQIQSSYKIKPVVKLQELAEICFNLVENLLAQLLVLKTESDCSRNSVVPLSRQDIKEVAESIFCHPAVLAPLSCPLDCKEDLVNMNMVDSLDMLISLSRQRVHKLDHHVLNILRGTSEYLLTLCNGQDSVPKVEKNANKQLVRAFKAPVQKLMLEARDKFDLSIRTKDLMPLLPTFYALHALIRFISPFELLELVQWMFNRIDMEDLTVSKNSKISALSVGFCIAAGAFKTVSSYLEQPVTRRVPYNLLWEIEEENINVDIVEEIYIKVVNFAMHFEPDFADICLLEAVNTGYRQKFNEQPSIHPLSLVLSRVLSITPVELLSHCIFRTNKTKAKLLFLLTERSSLHLSIFGHLFLDILKKDFHHKDNVMVESCGLALSDDDFMMLLPAALSYLKSMFMKFGNQYRRHFEDISSLYSRILLNGFLHWKSFVSGNIFEEEYGEFLPSSTQELLSLVDGTLLGKSIHMLQYHFAFSGVSMKMKKRLKLFDKIFPRSNAHVELLDCDVGGMDSHSLNQSLNHINRVVAKISFCRILLFMENNQIMPLPKETNGDLKEVSLEIRSNSESSRMRFMNILVSIWQWIIKKLPLVSDSSAKEKRIDSSTLYKHLGVFILKSIFELTAEMHDGLVQLQSVPFLEDLMRSVLLYRFEDPTTLKALRGILTLLCDGKFSRVPYIQLLVAHSQFAPTIHSVSKSSGCPPIGAFSRPMPSILRSLIPYTKQNAVSGKSDVETTKMYARQLEVIKLLCTLFPVKAHQSGFESGKDFGINFKELHLLLLSSYGATHSEVDLEIYSLMNKIESVDGSGVVNIAEMDYLWGSAALKVKKERAVEQDISSGIMTDTETIEERRKNQFRENLSIDPKICASTVLYFPYDAIACGEPLSLNKVQSDYTRDMLEAHSPVVENIDRYDPFFILRFSIHSLSLGYIEPVEFASLGLLAVAFVSMSSSDDRIRKLGYETLGLFKQALEKCQKRKDVMQLRLLMNYVQNGVEEPWQKIPSVISLFAAEASFILLDPSHDHYTTISKLLMQSSRVNMKGIPFFHNFFWSSAVNFRAERLWILRLLYAGLNLDDDAQIYIRNSIFETILSFYVSPLSDNDSKELILQIVKKSVKLQKMARYLAEHCGLFPWLSSILSFSSRRLFRDEKSFSLMQLLVVLEVVNDVISSRNITEWLQKFTLEQLMELSSHLYKIFFGDVTLIKENVALVNPFLQIMIATLKISQKRKIYQPHFTLSVEGLYQIYQAVNVYNYAGSCPCAEDALKAVLMGTPPVALFHMNRDRLSSFVMWAISTALKSDSAQMLQFKESHPRFTISLEEEIYEDSLISKLLRWLSAAVILGKLSWKSNDLGPEFSNRLKLGTLQSLLDLVGNACDESIQSRFGCEDLLASSIFYLQQLLGNNCRVLPSVVSALCLLFYATDFAESRSAIFHISETLVASLCSKIRCPAEANPAWRWSFYQPWKDRSLELSELQKMEEQHACQTLLVSFANMLRNKSLDLQVLSPLDVERCGVYEWEKGIIGTCSVNSDIE